MIQVSVCLIAITIHVLVNALVVGCGGKNNANVSLTGIDLRPTRFQTKGGGGCVPQNILALLSS